MQRQGMPFKGRKGDLPDTLQVAEGARVMLTRNIDVEDGLATCSDLQPTRAGRLRFVRKGDGNPKFRIPLQIRRWSNIPGQDFPTRKPLAEIGMTAFLPVV
ncbi:hypothetical protein SKAU_G00185610 [Synaphobranchus kaupii]|uniref:ATP-dependent DNA helicase n=1 Tax=Synaphobranchus kaupii TaxID=118154 RepID=A0A9Q1FCK0_SYNKA|nr:hypothetical protein SKAU_G00185610 [Synaphobranchus kaupii]